MKRTFWHQLDTMARQSTPFMLTLVLVIFIQLPLYIPEFAHIMPLLPLMAIYHWAIYRSELLPAYAVFFIGLLQDALSGAPIGVHAAVYLAVYGTVLSQHRFFFGKSFLIVWLGFGLIAAVASLAGWLLVSAWNVTIVEPKAVVFQYLVTIGFFPVVGWLFLLWQRAFLKLV